MVCAGAVGRSAAGKSAGAGTPPRAAGNRHFPDPSVALCFQGRTLLSERGIAMRFSRPLRFSRHRPSRLGAFGLSLVALGLAALAPTAARAQTQDLFVSSLDSNTILRFAGTGPGGIATRATTITAPNSQPSIAFDANGNLFAIAGNSIIEFASTGTGSFNAGTVVATGSTNAGGLAFDKRGDLFVSSFENTVASTNSITEFAAGATPGTFGARTVLTAPSLEEVMGLAFDANGDLFAANSRGSTQSSTYGSITEFAAGATPGTFGATTTLTDPSLNDPSDLAVDARGDVFVANSYYFRNSGPADGYITEFPLGAAPGNLRRAYNPQRRRDRPIRLNLRRTRRSVRHWSNWFHLSGRTGKHRGDAGGSHTRNLRRASDSREPPSRRNGGPGIRPARPRSLHDRQFRPAAGPGNGRAGNRGQAQKCEPEGVSEGVSVPFGFPPYTLPATGPAFSKSAGAFCHFFRLFPPPHAHLAWFMHSYSLRRPAPAAPQALGPV